PPLRTELTLDRAILADIRGDADEAWERYRQVLERARKAGDPERLSQAMVGLAELARFRGDLERAESLYSDALAIQRRMGHQRFIAITLVNLCMVALAREDLDAASGFLDEVAELGADVSHPEVAVVYAFSRALIAGRRGDLEEARSEIYRFQAVNARVQLHEPDIANALEELSERFRTDGDEVFADELLHETLQMWRQLGRADLADEAEERTIGGGMI
ncbi:MAG: tetratricopeptide repeat protein, partial [Myxococcota bacterium]|nr:tetratricopeptide repeat protein [Myxococcota bacterium]